MILLPAFYCDRFVALGRAVAVLQSGGRFPRVLVGLKWELFFRDC